MPGPLKGVNVLDVGTAAVGPWAATLLGYLGANVIKVESPAGDRHLYQPPLQNKLSTTYTIGNLNKLASVLDLKAAETQESLNRLIFQANVVVDNLRPGVVNRLGLGYDAITKLNPDIISASSPAWGEQGPMQRLPAFDLQVQMFSGFASINGMPGEELEILRYPHLDFNASCFFTASIIIGIIARERLGRSQRVTASHLGSAIALQMTRIGEYLATGNPPKPMGSGCASTVPHQAFGCRDNRWLLVGVETEAQWKGFCEALERPDLLDDPRYLSNRLRVQNQNDLVADLEGTFASHPARWWALRLEQYGVPFSYTRDFQELRYHSQVVENEFMIPIEVPHQGPLIVGGVPWLFSETPASIERAPAPGQDTQQVLAQGFGRERAMPKASSADSVQSSRPLEGFRVLDASQGHSGPFATLLLAESGAEVIKVEPPGGDYVRGFAPATLSSDSAAFVMLNRNKQSIVLDLDTESDRRLFRSLASTCDVIVEDWGPGVAEARSLDYQSLAKQRQDIIYCALTPFGEKGPLRSLPATELTVQGWSEYWKNLGAPGDPPQRTGADIVGLDTGVMACIGILAAIYYRLRTGKGQRLAISMLGTMMSLRTAQWAAMSNPDSWEGEMYCNNSFNGPWRGYRTKDRPIHFNLNNCTEEQFSCILTALGMADEVSGDKRFDNAGRETVAAGRYTVEVWSIWEKYFQRCSSKEVTAILIENGGVAVEAQHYDELAQHPQVATLGLFSQGSDGNWYIRAPWRGSWPEVSISMAPGCGAHTGDILSSVAGV